MIPFEDLREHAAVTGMADRVTRVLVGRRYSAATTFANILARRVGDKFYEVIERRMTTLSMPDGACRNEEAKDYFQRQNNTK